jgi:hypothetical protein
MQLAGFAVLDLRHSPVNPSFHNRTGIEVADWTSLAKQALLLEGPA